MNLVRIANLRRFRIDLRWGGFGCGGGSTRTLEVRCDGDRAKVWFVAWNVEAIESRRVGPVEVDQAARDLLGELADVAVRRDDELGLESTAQSFLSFVRPDLKRERRNVLELKTRACAYSKRDVERFGPEPFIRVHALHRILDRAWREWGGPEDS